MRKIAKIAVWIMTGLGLLWLSRPFFSPGYFFTHDIDAHITRGEAYFGALREFQFPVRWIGWAFHDGGTPLFTYYSGGFYLIVTELTLLGIPFSWSVQLSIWLLWVLGGIGIMLFMRKFGYLSSWVAGILWWLSSYMITDIFLRSALPELTALSFSMWGWLVWDRWLMKPSLRLGLLTSLIFSAIIVSHLPTALFMFPVYLGYGLVLSSKKQMAGIRFWFLATMMGIFSLGLSCYYVLPAASELPFIRSQELREGYYNYQDHFLQPWQLFWGNWHYGASYPGTDNDMSFAQSPGQWMIALLALGWTAGLCIFRKNKTNKHLGFAIFWLVVTGTAYFLTLDISKPLWNALPFLGFIQYPWRAFLLSTLGTAALGGWLISHADYGWQKGIFLLIVVVGVILINGKKFEPFGRIPFDKYPLERFFYHEEPYPPVGVEEAYLPIGSNAEAAMGLPILTTREGNATITNEKVTSDHINAAITTSTASSILVRRWWFPGWSMTANGTPIHVLQDEKTGLINFFLTQGKYDISLRYTGTSIENLSNIITIITVIVWMLLMVISVVFFL